MLETHPITTNLISGFENGLHIKGLHVLLTWDLVPGLELMVSEPTMLAVMLGGGSWAVGQCELGPTLLTLLFF